MSIYVNDKYRIRRSASQQEGMSMLTKIKVFENYRDILMASAIIGYNNGQYIEIDDAASDGVLMQFFTPIDKDMMDLIAYAHSKNQAILYTDEKYKIFEAYANGGFPILFNIMAIENTNLSEGQIEDYANKYYVNIIAGKFNEHSINEFESIVEETEEETY